MSADDGAPAADRPGPRGLSAGGTRVRGALLAAVAGGRSRLAGVRTGEYAVAALTLVGTFWLVAPLLGTDRAVVTVLAAGAVGAAVYGLNGERAAGLLVAGAVGVLAALLASSVVGMGLSLLGGGIAFGTIRLFAVVAALAAGTGATLAGSDAPGGGTVWRATRRLGVGTLVVVAALSVLATAAGSHLNPVGIVWAVVRIVVRFSLSADPGVALASLVVANVVGALPTAVTLYLVDLGAVVPPARRHRVAALQGRATRVAAAWLVAAVLLGPSLVVVALLGPGIDTPSLVDAVGPLGGLVRFVLTFVGVRALAVLLGVVSALVLVVAVVGRRLRRLTRHQAARASAPALGTTGVALVVAVLLARSERLDAVVAALPPLLRGAVGATARGGDLVLGLALVTLALLVTLAVWTLVSVAGRVGALPDRVAGVAMAAGGLFLGSLAAMLAGRVVAALVGATLAFVVWDAGEAATGLDEDVGASVAARRLEVVRIGASTAVGVGAVVLVVVLATVANAGILAPAGETFAAAGVVLALVATLSALLALKG